MPDRLIRESWCSSESIDRLTPFEETVLARMIVNCDDFGRMDGRPSVLCSRLFVTRRSVEEQEVAAAVARLEEEGFLLRYEVEERPYIQMQGWGRHQRIRNQRSKYPAPLDPSQAAKGQMPPQVRRDAAAADPSPQAGRGQNTEEQAAAPSPQTHREATHLPQAAAEDVRLPRSAAEGSVLPAPADNCCQLPSIAAECGYNPIQSESESKSESKSESESLTGIQSESDDGLRERARENFLRFWKQYPKKAGKEEAFAAFMRSGAYGLDQQMLLDALREQRKSENWRKESGRFIPKPANWLMDGRWEERPLPACGGHDLSDIDCRTYEAEELARLIPDPTLPYREEEVR